MAERSSLNQIIQLGIESTSGTAVAATKKMQTLGIEPTVAVNIDEFRPAGAKYRTLTALSKEWVTANVTGKGSYTECVYPLSSVMDVATITTPMGATNARLWTFISDTYVDDAPKTYTIEHGSAVRADKFAYGIFPEFGMKFNRNSGVDVSGAMFGTRITDNITLTSAGSVSTVALVPILAPQVSVYLDTTSGGLGGTKLTRAVSADWKISGRFNPVWVLDAAQSSFATHIETEPSVTLTLLVEADSQGMGLLTDMRAGGTTKWVRIEAVGASDSIESGQSYTFTLDLACQVKDTGGFTDADGLYAIEWTLVAVHDETWGQAFKVAVKNALTAL